MKKDSKNILIRALVLTIYIFVGGAIFQLLEKANKLSMDRKYKLKLVNFQQKYNISTSDMSYIEETIAHYGQHSVSSDWNYGNAVFFAGSTILTVGYGNIVPRTTQGKVFCMIYALFGIPIACLALRSLGEKMMNIQISLIRKAYKRMYNTCVSSVHLKATLLNFILTLVVVLLFGAMTLLKRRDWCYFDGVYFVFISFTTIGFGDYVPSYDEGFSEFDILSILLSFFIGFALVSSLLCSMSGAFEEYGVKSVIKRAKTKMDKKRGRNADLSNSFNKHSGSNDSSIAFDNEAYNDEEGRVNLQVSLQRVTMKRHSCQWDDKSIMEDGKKENENAKLYLELKVPNKG
eukprot:gene9709-10695_t